MKSIRDPRYVQMIDHLRSARKAKKISQAALGERLCWDQRDISKVESLVRRLDFIELYDWLVALDCQLSDVIRDIGLDKG